MEGGRIPFSWAKGCMYIFCHHQRCSGRKWLVGGEARDPMASEAQRNRRDGLSWGICLVLRGGEKSRVMRFKLHSAMICTDSVPYVVPEYATALVVLTVRNGDVDYLPYASVQQRGRKEATLSRLPRAKKNDKPGDLPHTSLAFPRPFCSRVQGTLPACLSGGGRGQKDVEQARKAGDAEGRTHTQTGEKRKPSSKSEGERERRETLEEGGDGDEKTKPPYHRDNHGL